MPDEDVKSGDTADNHVETDDTAENYVETDDTAENYVETDDTAEHTLAGTCYARHAAGFIPLSPPLQAPMFDRMIGTNDENYDMNEDDAKTIFINTLKSVGAA